jgi:hypothetical protein
VTGPAGGGRPVSPENAILAMKRRGAYLTLCGAMDDNDPVCGTLGPWWDQMSPREQMVRCKECPLKKQCLAYAELDPINTYGVWGGRSYPRTPTGRKKDVDHEL